MGKISYLIIQPHSDDALFSASHLLFSGKKVSVLTVEKNSKRIEEDRKLYEFINVPWDCLNVEFDDQSFYGFHKQYDTVNLSNATDYLTEYFGKDKLKEIAKALAIYIKNFVEKNGKTNIYIPFGVGHPFHIFIRDVVERNYANEIPLFYYRDFPHSYKRRAKTQMAEQLIEYELLSSHDVTEYADMKWGLAKKFYKSQSGLLWFEQNYIKKNLPEEVYRHREDEEED